MITCGALAAPPLRGLLCTGARESQAKTTARIVRIGEGGAKKNCKRATTSGFFTFLTHGLQNRSATPARVEKKSLLRFVIWLSKSTGPFVMSEREPKNWVFSGGGGSEEASPSARCSPRPLSRTSRKAHLFSERENREIWLGATNTWLIVPFRPRICPQLKTFTRQMCNRGTAGAKIVKIHEGGQEGL